MKKVGLWLAIAALLVNGPRFVLIFLRIDNIGIPLETEAIMLGATGVATGLVLTGGGAYIAHSLAESKARGITQFVMIVCWFLLLVFSVILLAPLMVSAIRVSPLNSVFTSPISQWMWSITAVAAVEIISAGAMAAYALEGKSQDGGQKEEQGTFSILTGALVKRLEHHIAPQPSVHLPNLSTGSETILPTAVDTGKNATQLVTGDSQQETDPQGQNDPLNGDEPHIEADRQHSKSERQKLLLELIKPLTKEEEIAVDELANHLGVSRQTIYRDLSDLKKTNQLRIEEGKIVPSESGN